MYRTVSVPIDILDDPNVSLNAKGLYVLLSHRTDTIEKLEDLTIFTNNTKEELVSCFEELTENGYLVKKRSGFELQIKSTIKSKRTTKEEATEFAENATKVVPLNKYQKLMKLIERYQTNNQFSPNLTSLLKVYFEKWLNKKDRFANADDLHGQTVQAKIGNLISLHITDDLMIKSVQNSIDHGWFDFYNPNKVDDGFVQNTVQSRNFNPTGIVSGTYTKKDIENIKKRAEELGDKGVF